MSVCLWLKSTCIQLPVYYLFIQTETRTKQATISAFLPCAMGDVEKCSKFIRNYVVNILFVFSSIFFLFFSLSLSRFTLLLHHFILFKLDYFIVSLVQGNRPWLQIQWANHNEHSNFQRIKQHFRINGNWLISISKFVRIFNVIYALCSFVLWNVFTQKRLCTRRRKIRHRKTNNAKVVTRTDDNFRTHSLSFISFENSQK